MATRDSLIALPCVSFVMILRAILESAMTAVLWTAGMVVFFNMDRSPVFLLIATTGFFALYVPMTLIRMRVFGRPASQK
jgi:hypothetical protein